MKKAILTLVGMFLISGFINAQVIADFEDSDGAFVKGWGDATFTLSKIADPSGVSTGVLELNVTAVSGNKQAVIKKQAIDGSKGKLVVYYLWLPASTPDDVQIKVWAQGAGWHWKDNVYTAAKVTKEKWFPVYFDIEAAHLQDAGFDPMAGNFEEMGIEFMFPDGYTGSIYIDNVSIFGAEPKVIGDFEADAQGFAKGWGEAVFSVLNVPDPSTKSAGVMEVNVTALAGNNQAVIKKSAVDAKEAKAATWYLWLPAGTPDSIAIKVWAQGPGWKWKDVVYTSWQLKKETWYPVHFLFEAAHASDPNFDATLGNLEEMGIEFNFAKAPGFAGSIYIDNVSLIGTATGAKWVVANFESAAAKAQGFTRWFGGASELLDRAVVDNKGVLKFGVDFSKAINDGKAAIKKDNVVIYDKVNDAVATFITIDAFVPAGINADGTGQIGLVVNGPEGGWNETPKAISDTLANALVPGEWGTITFDVTAALTAGTIADPTKPVTVAIQIYHPNANGFVGDFLFDNLTVWNVTEPKGTVSTPKISVTANTYTMQTGIDYQYVKLTWLDNTLGTESYNLYVSEEPITDLNSPKVKRVVSLIPHGMEAYGYRPYSTDGAIKNLYFAMTAFDGKAETAQTADGTFGPLTIKTSKTYKVNYKKDFASSFELDGDNADFIAIQPDPIKAESGGYADQTLPDWEGTSTDMNFETRFVIDDTYLYMSAEVIDDDLRTDEAQQAWEGDALEFFMGFYGAEKLQVLHEKNLQKTNGDYRIGFNALGTVCLDGGSPVTVDGVEAVVFQKLTGDGYIIEARIELAKVAGSAGKLDVYDGMMMPFRIDGNDWDPNKGDAARSLVVQVGGMPLPKDEVSLSDQSWMRPDAWGYLEVINGPTSVEGTENTLPTVYSLSNNYPNPFNPTTKIKYDLPKESMVTLKVFDILGREVTTLVSQNQKAGYYEVNFNGSQLATGVYVFRIQANDFVQTKKMMLVK
ncbi:MAG: T9SS type A sorting domain-containing protein [Melioribacteraceae bacterium]|nr:T9SS type A sorting domain-containing protein [Melioribacteraceae bacterium]